MHVLQLMNTAQDQHEIHTYKNFSASSICNFKSSTLVFLYFSCFLYISSSRENQAICLDDLPPMIEKYNYLKDDIRPGEKFNAKKQCQQSFDKSFIPHVTKTSPFEVYYKKSLYKLTF